MNVRQQYIAKSKYSRFLDHEGRREHWPETVSRYFNFMAKHLYKNCNYSIPPETFNRLEQGVRDLEFLPSMRGLMTAGPAAERNHLCFYNCSFLPIDNQVAFDEIMFILLCGTGVGFSVERHHIGKLPEIPEKIYDSDTTIVVSDSKEGWAKALRQLIALLYSGEAPKWDLSKVRPAGARLKTFGGRSSGPEVLGDLFRFVVNIFKNAQGRKLTSLECHDIACKIGEIVVVGGTRRSALISLSDLEDNELRYAKSGRWWEREPQRALANNSAVYKQKPKSKQFLQEMLALIESESGERGIFNREGVRKSFERISRDLTNLTSVGTNPSLAKGTRLWTETGIFEIQNLEDKEFVVRNREGFLSKARCWLSSDSAPLFNISLHSGIEYKATAEHKWPCFRDGKWVSVKTSDLQAGDSLKFLRPESVFPEGTKGSYLEGFVIGWNLGDGWSTTRKDSGKTQYGFIVEAQDRESGVDKLLTDFFVGLGVSTSLINKKEINISNKRVRDFFDSFGFVHKHQGLPSAVWDAGVSDEFRKGLIDGLFSSDGYVSGTKDRRISLSGGSKSLPLMKDVADLLGFFGVSCRIHSRKSVKSNFGCFDRHDLCIGRREDIKLFSKLFSLTNKKKQERLNTLLDRWKGLDEKETSLVVVKSVSPLDVCEPVWDIAVEDLTHSFQLAHCVTGNCGEILLNPHQLCNLSTVVVRPDDSLPDLEEKIRCAAILGTYQASMTNFKYLRSSWKKQTAEEALLGVSMTGICDHPVIGQVSEESAHWLQVLRQTAIDTNREVAALLGINPAAAVTCIKPEGTVSQLANTSSGMHPNFARYYLRTYRSDNKDPLTDYLKQKGVYSEPAFTQESTTTVFYFPVKAPDHAVLREHMTALDQLRLWLHYKKNYTQHNPSVTIFVKDHEWPEVISWVYDNFDDIVGVSFLPYSDHSYQQAPFQEITEEQYHEWVARTPEEIDWDGLVELSDNVQGVQTLSCTSGQCEL